MPPSRAVPPARTPQVFVTNGSAWARMSTTSPSAKAGGHDHLETAMLGGEGLGLGGVNVNVRAYSITCAPEKVTQGPELDSPHLSSGSRPSLMGGDKD